MWKYTSLPTLFSPTPALSPPLSPLSFSRPPLLLLPLQLSHSSHFLSFRWGHGRWGWRVWARVAGAATGSGERDLAGGGDERSGSGTPSPSCTDPVAAPHPMQVDASVAVTGGLDPAPPPSPAWIPLPLYPPIPTRGSAAGFKRWGRWCRLLSSRVMVSELGLVSIFGITTFFVTFYFRRWL